MCRFCLCYETVKLMVDMLRFLKVKIRKPAIIFSDNQAAIQAYKSDHPTKRSKFIDVRYHKIKIARRRKEVKIDYVETEKNPADLLTKIAEKYQFLNLVGDLVRDFDEMDH